MARGDLRRRALVAVLAASALAGIAFAAACGASADALEGTSSGGTGDASAATDGGGNPITDAGLRPISANGVVLVHAASFPAFRICFDGTRDEQPIPAKEAMPSSNLPGVDVGTAIRLAPRPGLLGRAHVFSEASIRSLYFNVPSAGPDCSQLLQLSDKESIEVASNLPDLSIGTHLLVLRGCARQALDPQASTTRCGTSWNAATGNLTLERITVSAFARPSTTSIPFQVIQLSHDLDERARGRALGVAFGDLDGSVPEPLVEGAIPAAAAVPNPPALLDYGMVGAADFASTGVFVTLGEALDDAGKPFADAGDAGPRETVLAQSLADIQRRSSARSLPVEWFSTASSYVVLSIGEIDPKTPDGGPDEARALHLLAIPLATPDGGADSGQ